MFDALHALPVMQRKTVLLRHWLGLSVEEAAHELGISTGTVKSHTSRGLRKLHETLTRTDLRTPRPPGPVAVHREGCAGQAPGTQRRRWKLTVRSSG